MTLIHPRMCNPLQVQQALHLLLEWLESSSHRSHILVQLQLHTHWLRVLLALEIRLEAGPPVRSNVSGDTSKSASHELSVLIVKGLPASTEKDRAGSVVGVPSNR
jgi:hypothetical protein